MQFCVKSYATTGFLKVATWNPPGDICRKSAVCCQVIGSLAIYTIMNQNDCEAIAIAELVRLIFIHRNTLPALLLLYCHLSSGILNWQLGSKT